MSKDNVMSAEAFKLRMIEIGKDYGGDCEVSHCEMDTLLANLLISLGYEEGIKIFQESEKWYA